MNIKKIRSVLIISALLLVAVSALAKTIWKDKNIYSSGESLQVGDIISIYVDDISQMKFSMSLADNSTVSITSNPDPNLTGFLPKVSANKKINNSDKTDVAGKGNLKIIIGGRVTRKLNDGKFEFNGNREYSFNGVVNRFTVSGLIDPAYLKGRAVYSNNIANFRLEIRGLKEAAGIGVARPPLKEGESASQTLTEAEKQKIIIDYLNKMLKELSR